MAEPAGHARSWFVDAARAIATLMMLQGHALDAVLAADVRTGSAFHIWSFFRGLTSCLFLLVSGFVFALATRRRWTDHLTSSSTIWRRLRRFGFFLVIGYGLHFPMAKFQHLYQMPEERWRSFLVVDVLQCIAVTLAALQVLVLVARTPRRHAIATAVGCAALVGLTPLVWRIDWLRLLPESVAAYLSPATGSQFPIFPWAGYPLSPPSAFARE